MVKEHNSCRVRSADLAVSNACRHSRSAGRTLQQVMKSRAFNVIALCSAVLFFMSVVAWLAAWKIDPQKEFVSLGGNSHFSLGASGADARFVAFNDAGYGPYSGSIVRISSINHPSQLDPSVHG